ncbi:hypothetical protein [Pannonibacter phragmitetus]|uniref:hypothetical protein n=1 Tax=Pannonibacter phragmitetus TaxID=121719 RepID=UPI0019818946|nr:hypothetical protein [Pannonibacter phragmitetus]
MTKTVGLACFSRAWFSSRMPGAFGFFERVVVPGKSVPVFLKPSFLRHAMA